MNDSSEHDEGSASPETAAEAPAPKRRRATSSATEAVATEGEAAALPKRTRRKPAADAAAAADAPPDAASADEAPVPRKRAPRKTAVADAEPSSDAAAAEPAALPPGVLEAVEAAAAARVARSAPEPRFSLGPDAAPADVQGRDDGDDDGDGDGEGDAEGDDGDDRNGRRRNRRRNRRERAEQRAAEGGVAPAVTAEPAAPLAPELVEAAGARFSDVISGELDAESAVPDAEPPKLIERDEGAEDAADGEGADAKRVLAADADAPKLQKVLAQAGIASRRDIEQWIADGRIEVNGEVAHVGQRVSFGDQVKVNGKPVRFRISPPTPRILAYHKPTGEVSTFHDPEGRPTVFRTLPRIQGCKWQSVGRLDINTEGLLLFTNSGELANQLMHPRFGVEREYAARVLGTLSEEQRAKLLEGVNIEGQVAAFKAIVDGGGEGANHWYRVTITEGRNREVRKLFETVGLAVSRLIRIRYGTVVLPRGLKRGVWVELGDDDVRIIRRLAGGPTQHQHAQPQQQPQHQGQGQGQRPRDDKSGKRRPDRNSSQGPRPSRPPEPARAERPYEAPPQRERSRDDEDDDFIPRHINPLEQTFDRRQATSKQRGFPQGFGAGGSSERDAGWSKPQKGGGPREPDPLQTSVGYIGGDAYLRRGGGGGGGGRGGKGGGGGGGGRGRR